MSDLPLSMRHLLTPLLFSIVLFTAAQPPQLGPWSFFQQGHSYLRHSYDIHPVTMAALIAADGELYTIDLDWLNDGILYTSDSISCGPAPAAYAFHTDYYDTANVLLSISDRELGGERMHLFRVANDTVKYVGGQPNGTGGTGDDLVFQRYPTNDFETILFPDIAFGTSWTDVINGEFQDASGSDEHFLDGTSTTTADGAGSITLPDGTFLPHTLRLRTVRDYIDDNALFGPIARQDTLYTWWVDSWDGPLMTLPVGDYGMMHGYVSPLPFTIYTRLGEQPVSIAEVPRRDVRVGPNPCHDRLFVHTEEPRSTYRVVDISGRVVLQGELIDRVIDVAGLAAGNYTLVLGTDPVGHARFVVDHGLR